MNFNTQSVMKAAAIGAAVNAVIGILAGVVPLAEIDAITTIVALFACCGGFLIPVATGALYGYFTPGKEEMGQAAAGGALSGLVAGLVYGVVQAIVNAVVIVVQGGDFVATLTAGANTIVGSCCGAFIFGTILGAVGGVVWSLIQKDK